MKRLNFLRTIGLMLVSPKILLSAGQNISDILQGEEYIGFEVPITKMNWQMTVTGQLHQYSLTPSEAFYSRPFNQSKNDRNLEKYNKKFKL